MVWLVLVGCNNYPADHLVIPQLSPGASGDLSGHRRVGGGARDHGWASTAACSVHGWYAMLAVGREGLGVVRGIPGATRAGIKHTYILTFQLAFYWTCFLAFYPACLR